MGLLVHSPNSSNTHWMVGDVLESSIWKIQGQYLREFCIYSFCQLKDHTRSILESNTCSPGFKFNLAGSNWVLNFPLFWFFVMYHWTASIWSKQKHLSSSLPPVSAFMFLSEQIYKIGIKKIILQEEYHRFCNLTSKPVSHSYHPQASLHTIGTDVAENSVYKAQMNVRFKLQIHMVYIRDCVKNLGSLSCWTFVR